MFGSAFLGAHLMRGAAAAALLAWAIVHQTAHPWLSLGAGVAALVALRGCPMCWTVGLVETLSQGHRDSTAERADRTWLERFPVKWSRARFHLTGNARTGVARPTGQIPSG